MEQEMTVRELAALGGLARARKLSKKRLSQIGRKAVKARWARYYARLAKAKVKGKNKQCNKTQS